MLEIGGAESLGLFFLVDKLMFICEMLLQLLLLPPVRPPPPPPPPPPPVLFRLRDFFFFLGLLESEWLVPVRATRNASIPWVTEPSRVWRSRTDASLLAFEEEESVGEMSGESSHCRRLIRVWPSGMSKPSLSTAASALGSIGLKHQTTNPQLESRPSFKATGWTLNRWERAAGARCDCSELEASVTEQKWAHSQEKDAANHFKSALLSLIFNIWSVN